MYFRSGTPRAYLLRESVYSYPGVYLGRFQKGFFRDTAGFAVGFIRGASGGPIPPVPSVSPVPPVPGIPPVPGVPAIAPVPPIPRLQWSNLRWDDFLTG